ncbi:MULTISPECIES: bifunctional homocysteine S-methyltransferase/methylenetetrahydrofolate reductase [unclassified Clostridioides]|uniref:bifunctional homocysteine S-methyltransferase/methylenetetrahydrofolate reductase n=1 Tax=unclassified Clostridioides TaxID=2635829 RepID=UPI001D0C6391|nr:bifunctional homocysteine S-methyltransferase/methylenetetrahydrofolate reductase [Clostridioides sp. ES-S-0001-02]MCC0639607.1 bifunctional homocysteine S-methyltransferase/methylenetetrahydrofolate reductase [Clostridioides sp. ES-S-0049-03]MCC0655869.1 bifunctional homocysteine S-methyltransferase/methylenetetrahydrofolate reductase [Clostridioides sp. ES-S-0123-01]MCC0676466.1 bifunctional homocysteine S-methyltransferase/methylenetetrahydrofolate reductase [Clostridioides sp. ES-W-0018-0
MNINEYIKDSVLVFDGAMGTYYSKLKNSPFNCEIANINDASTILSIHEEYIKAGCMAIKTNTFAANETLLECDFKTVKDIIKSGYEIALEATRNTDVFIFADIGPIPALNDRNLLPDYKKIVDVFLEIGATNFLFETFSSDEYLPEISSYIKEKQPNAFILTEFAVNPEGFTRLGKSGTNIFKSISKDKNIDALGFNCISGPHHLLHFIKTLDINDNIVSIMPNAGYPTIINNRTFFEDNSDYFSEQMLEILNQGVHILGGCCGTTPEFIKKTVEIINSLYKGNVAIKNDISPKEKIKSVAKNELLEKLDGGKKIIAVELDPPIDTDIEFFMNSAEKLKNYGVDAITIADCPIARARVDSSLLACKIKRELDITPIPHMTCRDRNINATKALLLGLNIENINNVLVVTGDPIPSAERDEIKAMFSFNSSILANYIKTLNKDTFNTPFNIFGALNINATNFDSQLKHAKIKIENGVTMFLTQPVLTEQALLNLKKAKEILPAKILGGIIPVVSYKNACFMNNEISGITVSQDIIDMYKDASKEQSTKLAINISTQIAKEIEPYVDGYYIITPFKRIDIVCDILAGINK